MATPIRFVLFIIIYHITTLFTRFLHLTPPRLLSDTFRKCQQKLLSTASSFFLSLCYYRVHYWFSLVAACSVSTISSLAFSHVPPAPPFSLPILSGQPDQKNVQQWYTYIGSTYAGIIPTDVSYSIIILVTRSIVRYNNSTNSHNHHRHRSNRRLRQHNYPS